MIHPSAIVHPGAKIAESAQIGPFCVIDDKVVIGEGTTIGAHSVISGPTEIGKNNHIYSQVALGGAPQDKKYAGENTLLTIGDGNTIREFCTINRGTSQDRGVTSIGDDNWIMAYVHIAHDVDIGHHTILANNTTLAGHVSVGDHAILGGFSKAHQFCRIGAHSFCAMDAGLSKDLPPYVVAAGHLAEPKGINVEGLSRRGFSKQQIKNIRQAYKIIYRSDLKLQESIEQLSQLVAEQPELDILVSFLNSTERSIIR